MNGSDQATDEILLERTSQGDERAFQLLYERYRNTTFRFAYGMRGSVDQAEDVSHDCFLALIRRPRQWDPRRASLRTYLYSTVRNLTLKRFRRIGIESATDDLPEEKCRSDSMEPLHRLLDEELSAVVDKAIAQLPPLQREALVLFEYEEQSLAEIAAIVGTDVGTAKSRLHRARERLKQNLLPLGCSSPPPGLTAWRNGGGQSGAGTR